MAHKVRLQSRHNPEIFVVAILLALVLLGLYLRLLYLGRVSLFFDEFITLWAAKNVLARGLPIFPTGDLYSHGLLSIYLEAIFLRVFGLQEALLRLPSVVIGLVTIFLTYRVGSRLYSPQAGLLAAAWLATDPQAVIWSGRARMYVLLQLLILAAIYLFYEGGVARDRARYRYLGLFAFLLSLQAHTEAALLWPALSLALGVERGWRWLVRRDNLVLLLLGGLGVVALFLLSLVGQPGHLETIQEERPILSLTQGWWGGVRAFAPFFSDPWRLPAMLFSILGLPLLLRRRRSPSRYLLLILGSIMLVLIFLAGSRWRDPRYAFMVLPLFFLLAGAGAVEGLSWLLSRLVGAGQPSDLSQDLPLAIILLLVLSVAGFTAGVGWEETYRQEWGYDLAFRYLEEHREGDDLVLTLLPAASRLYLGRADYYAIQRGYESFVMEKGGQLVDRWTGAPLLNSTAQLEGLLGEGDGLWLVVDGWRLQSRYEVKFVELVLDQMDLIYEERGVMIFFSSGYRDRPPPQVSRPLSLNFQGRMMLRGYELATDEVDPGEALEVALLWQALEPEKGYVVFLHLTGEDGERIAQDDKEPLQALYQSALWPPEEVVRDRHKIPLSKGVPSGLYRLEMGLYEADTQDRLSILNEKGEEIGDKTTLDFIRVGGEVMKPEPRYRLEADLGGVIRLLGYDLPRSEVLPGEPFPLTLYWRAEGEIDRDYIVFVHLVGEEGQIWGQEDIQPHRGFYPTSYWDLGETVVDGHSIPVRLETPLGEYRLLVGMYLLSTMERLPVQDSQGRVVGDGVYMGNVRVTGEGM